MLDQIKDPPWEHDNKVVLEEKWRAANARALECERLKKAFSLIECRHSSRKVQKLEATLTTISEVDHFAFIAATGLYTTDLLSKDFEWFFEQQTDALFEIQKQIREEISSIPNCPEFLYKEYTKESKVLITLIQSKR